MAKSPVLISKKSRRHYFGWATLISFLNLSCVISVTIVRKLGTQPDRFESFIRFPSGTLPINSKQSIQRQCPNLHEEGSFVPYYLNHALCFLIYLLEGFLFPIALQIFSRLTGIAFLVSAYVEVAYGTSLGTASSSVRLVPMSTGSEQEKLAQLLRLLRFLFYLLVCGLGPHLLDMLGFIEEQTIILNASCGLIYTLLFGSIRLQKPIKPQKVDEKLEDHIRPDSLRNPEELSKKLASSTSICHEKTSTPERRPSSQQPQQQQNDTPKPSNQTVAGACGRDELTLHDEVDPDDNTENFCSRAHEKSTNELQRTSSEHWQQQKQESHHPEPNTPTRERRRHRWKRYNPNTQTTPQDTHERRKRRRVSNDQRKKHFYMDSGAAYHSTFDASVIKSYPGHLKPPIQAIQGFGGSTILVTGYGCIDGPGGKLKDVLLLPDSTANLMCLGQLTRDYPVKVEFFKDKFWIEGLHNGERVGEGHREDVNHYVVDRFQPDSLLINKRKPSKKKARQYTR